jgi:hypothetical protein
MAGSLRRTSYRARQCWPPPPKHGSLGTGSLSPRLVASSLSRSVTNGRHDAPAEGHSSWHNLLASTTIRLRILLPLRGQQVKPRRTKSRGNFHGSAVGRFGHYFIAGSRTRGELTNRFGINRADSDHGVSRALFKTRLSPTPTALF